MGVGRETDCPRIDGGPIDWRDQFLRHSEGDVFEYGRRVRAQGGRSPDELAELFGRRRAARLEAADLIARFSAVLDRGDAREVIDFFRDGTWARFADIKGFDGALAEMIGPHVEALDEKGLNALEDAVARALREFAGDPGVDGAQIAPALSAVFERARGMIAVESERVFGSRKRAALLVIVLIFVLVRAYFRMAG